MNKQIATILKIAEGVAKASIPGAAQVDDAVHAIVDHHGDTDDAILDAAEGAIKTVEAIEGEDIADEVKFRMGVAGMEASFKLIRQSLKPTPMPVTSPQADGAGT